MLWICHLTDGRGYQLAKLLGRGMWKRASIQCNSDRASSRKSIIQSSQNAREACYGLTQLSTPELSNFAGWPDSTFHDADRQRPLCSDAASRQQARFADSMGRNIDKRSSLTLDWMLSDRAARNCAPAFATLHAKSVVIGACTSGPFARHGVGDVKMIDCDSFSNNRKRGNYFAAR